MIKERNGKVGVDGVLALVLLGVFAVCVLLVLLQGARTYQHLTQRGQDSYNERTAAQYIVTRVRQADTIGAVSISSLGGTQTLELTETIDGDVYITRVYCYGGYIRELFSSASLEFAPGDGQCILPAEELEFALEDGLLTADITHESGERMQISVIVHSSQEGGYEE